MRSGRVMLPCRGSTLWHLHTASCAGRMLRAKRLHQGLQQDSLQPLDSSADGCNPSVSKSTHNMSEGSFFCVVHRPAPWYKTLSFKKKEHSADRQSLEDALEVVEERYSASLQSELASSLGNLPTFSVPRETHKFVYATGGLVWRPGLSPVGGIEDLIHVKPYVQQDAKSGRLCVFFGYLSNLDELARSCGSSSMLDVGVQHLDQHPGGSSYETTLAACSSHHVTGPVSKSLPNSRHSMQLPRPADKRGLLTTSTLLKLYDTFGNGQELLLLSELQGEYAFVIFDSVKKQAFAARDPTGEEDLFMAVDPNGTAMFTNSLSDIPQELEKMDWQEVPPGHYVAGKQPTLFQFALTMEQLQARERHESLDTLDDALLFGDTVLTTPTTEDGAGGASTPQQHDSAGSSSGLIQRFSKHWS